MDQLDLERVEIQLLERVVQLRLQQRAAFLRRLHQLPQVLAERAGCPSRRPTLETVLSRIGVRSNPISASTLARTQVSVRSSQHRNVRSRLRPMNTAFAPHRPAASRQSNSVLRTELQTVASRRADERTVGNLVPRVAGNQVGLRRPGCRGFEPAELAAVTGSLHGLSSDPQGSPQAAGKVVEMWTIPRAQNAANLCRGRLHGPVPTRRFALAPSTERE